MEAKPLVIRVEDIATRQAWSYVFDGGPVWVGCGVEASLVIMRPFVSLQHGCFRFDHHSVHYQDLDPTVGTVIDGEPAGAREVALTEWSQLELGELRVTVSRRPPDGPVLDPALSPFARPLPAHEPVPAMPATLVLPEAAVAPYRKPLREDPWSEIVDPGSTPAPARRSTPARPTKRRRRGRAGHALRRVSIWLSALLIGGGIVGVAGLLLQYRGLPWMPAELAAQVPPWLANLFR